MKRILCLFFGALVLAGCSDAFKGEVVLVTQTPDSKLSATVSRGGEENSRDAVFHIYLGATEGGTPNEAITITKASQVTARWESDSKILIVFNGGIIQITDGGRPFTVQTGTEKREVSYQFTNDWSRRS